MASTISAPEPSRIRRFGASFLSSPAASGQNDERGSASRSRIFSLSTLSELMRSWLLLPVGPGKPEGRGKEVEMRSMAVHARYDEGWSPRSSSGSSSDDSWGCGRGTREGVMFERGDSWPTSAVGAGAKAASIRAVNPRGSVLRGRSGHIIVELRSLRHRPIELRQLEQTEFAESDSMADTGHHGFAGQAFIRVASGEGEPHVGGAGDLLGFEDIPSPTYSSTWTLG